MFSPLISSLAAEEFLEPDAARMRLDDACERHPDVARFEEIGSSETGRPIDAVVLGRGPLRVSLIAGNHADEPVGPEFLRRFVLSMLDEPDVYRPLFERVCFCIVPQTNPDGEHANRLWRERWPDVEAYLEHARRDPPGRDMEFGFPDMRPENEVVVSFLRSEGPFDLHASLHGMAVAEGPMLLIERRWGYRTEHLQARFRSAVRKEGLALHDHNRKGEKGFFYLGPGFTTTPEGEAMRDFFAAKGETKTAKRFHDSSMEFVRRLGGDPLCYVTEFPLFLVERARDAPPGVPEAYLEFKERLPAMRLRLSRGESIQKDLDYFGVQPLSLPAALRLQLDALSAALEQISEDV
ncbi:MAG: M14 family zinc carboxypeptidase [Rhodothermales bacterium]